MGSVPLQGEYATDIEHGHLTGTTCTASIAGRIRVDFILHNLVLNSNPPGFQLIHCSWTQSMVSHFCHKSIKIHYNTDHGLDMLESMLTSQEDDNIPASIHPPVGKNLDKVKDGDDDNVTDDEDNKDDGDEDNLEGQKDGNEKDDREDDGERDCGDAGDIRLSGVLLYCFVFSSLIAMFPHPTACPLQQSRHILLQPLLLQHLTIQLQCIQALQVP